MENWKSHLIQTLGTEKTIVNAHAHIDRSFTLNLTEPFNNSFSLKAKQNRLQWLHDTFYSSMDLFKRYKKVFNSVFTSINTYPSPLSYHLYSFIDVSQDISDGALQELLRAYDTLTIEQKKFFSLYYIPYYVDKTSRRINFEIFRAIVSEYKWEEKFAGLGFLPDLDCANSSDEQNLNKFFDNILTSFPTIQNIHLHLDQENSPQSQQTNIFLNFLFKNFIHSPIPHTFYLVHVLSPASYTEGAFKKHLEFLQIFKNNIRIIICPAATLSNEQKREIISPTHNSIARALEYHQAGIKIHLGSDNVEDMFIPFNSFDMLDQIYLMANSLRYYNFSFYQSLLTNSLS